MAADGIGARLAMAGVCLGLSGCVFITAQEDEWRRGGPCEEVLWFADADGDGFGQAGTGVEACEGPETTVDNNDDCDDSDPDILGNFLAYEDLDGDGFGGVDSEVEACELKEGWVLVGDDCDDDDPAIQPGAIEDCATEGDDNCNGETNEVMALGCSDHYVDLDEDSWGTDEDLADTVCVCGPFDAYTATRVGDCDDGDDQVNPGAEEICGDFIDNDCDGGPGECGLSGLMDDVDANVALYGSKSGDHAGYSLAGGDLDGDGFGDLVIGTPKRDPGTGTDAGTVHVVMGGISGELDLDADADAKYSGENDGDHLGWSVAVLGDVDGNGVDDLLIGSLANDEGGALAGAAYLIHGPFTGNNVATAGVKLIGEAGAYAGSAVAAAGDVTGDGVPDALVGAYRESTVGSASGAVYIVSGTVSSDRDLSTFTKLLGVSGGDRSGIAVAGGEDLNGDGIADIAVGADRVDGDAGTDAGAVYIFHGPIESSGSLADADGIRTGPSAEMEAGSAVVLSPDLTGDGMADVVIGAPGTSAANDDILAEVYVVAGPADGKASLESAPATFLGEHINDRTGRSLAAPGDVDGDGAADLIMGAPLADNAASGGGMAYLVYGPVGDGRYLELADARIAGTGVNGQLGWSVAGVGDVNGDGATDIAIGGNGLSIGGGVILFHGGGL